jgi:hypothetical protein
MKKNILRPLSSVSVGLGLLAVYVVFLNQFFAVSNLSEMSLTESIILYTQIIRVIVLFLLGLKYQIQPIVPIIVFSIEALLIPPLLVLIIWTGSSFYATFMGVILTAWFGATALVLTPYTIYGFVRNLLRDVSFSGVLAIGAFELISVLFLTSLLNGVTQPIMGIAGLGNLIISQIRFEVGSGGVPNPAGDPVIAGGLLLFFLGILVYMTLGTISPTAKLRVPPILIVSLAGTLLSFLWLAVISYYQTDVLEVLTAPAIALFLIIWGTARGR